MIYKSYYCHLLIFSAYFYFVFALMDFNITMQGYYHYGNLFFEMEMNPVICYFVSNGIQPIYMFIIPIIVILLCVYLYHTIEKIQNVTIIRDRVIWGVWFSTSLISSIAIIHLLGFVSWFYHGAF